jgi:hypothetical protein
MCQISHSTDNRCVLIFKYVAGGSRRRAHTGGHGRLLREQAGMRGRTMTAAAYQDRYRVKVNAVPSRFTDTAMLPSSDQVALLPALEGFAILDVATPAEIADLYAQAVA